MSDGESRERRRGERDDHLEDVEAARAADSDAREGQSDPGEGQSDDEGSSSRNRFSPRYAETFTPNRARAGTGTERLADASPGARERDEGRDHDEDQRVDSRGTSRDRTTGGVVGWFRLLVAAVGLVAVGTAVVLVRRPDVVATVVDPIALERAVAGETGFGLVILLAIVAAAAAFVKGFSASLASPQPFADATESGTSDRPIAGQSFDETVTVAIGGARTMRQRRARNQVRKRLTTAAAERLAAIDGCDLETARERVDGGEWTDDAVAASFLGDETAPDAPLRWRLYEWLYDDRAFERAVDRTVEAIEAVDGGGRR